MESGLNRGLRRVGGEGWGVSVGEFTYVELYVQSSFENVVLKECWCAVMCSFDTAVCFGLLAH